MDFHKAVVVIDGERSEIPDTDTLEGTGDMLKDVYHPNPGMSSGDIFDRANHYGAIPLKYVQGIGRAAYMDVGLVSGTVASSDHTHPCCGGDMKQEVYDPLGLGEVLGPPADCFDRANHHSQIEVDVISDHGDAILVEVGSTEGTVAISDHTHDLSMYMAVADYDPQGVGADIFDRANHTSQVDYTNVSGLGDAALLDLGDQPGNVALGFHVHPMEGATQTDDGKSGFVPAPDANQETYLLMGDGAWHPAEDAFFIGLKLDRDDIQVLTASPDYLDGIVTDPPNPIYVLFGDGTWQDPMQQIITNNIVLDASGLPAFTPATAHIDGGDGVAPGPPADGQDYVLTGGAGLWMSLRDAMLQAPPMVADVAPDLVPLPGATFAGLAPAPAAGDANKVLVGTGTWELLTDVIAQDFTFNLNAIDPMAGYSNGGAPGLVPAPTPGEPDQVLNQEGWTDFTTMVKDNVTVTSEDIAAFQPFDHVDGPKKGMIPAPLKGTPEDAIIYGDGNWYPTKSFKFVGNWTATNYVKNDVVYFSGSSYICTKAEGTTSKPEEEVGGEYHWDLFIPPGDSGNPGDAGADLPPDLEAFEAQETRITSALNAVRSIMQLYTGKPIINTFFSMNGSIQSQVNTSTGSGFQAGEFGYTNVTHTPVVNTHDTHATLRSMKDVCAGQIMTLPDADIYGVDLLVRRYGYGTGHVSASLFQASGAVGAGMTVDTTSVVDSDDIPLEDLSMGFKWTFFKFNPPYAASSGTYAIMLFPMDVPNTAQFYVGDDTGNGYADGNSVTAIFQNSSPYHTGASEDIDNDLFFRAILGGGAMELVSNISSAPAVPSKGYVSFAVHAPVDPDINTNLKVFITRTSGTTWDQITMEEWGTYGRVYVFHGVVEFTGSSGSALAWKITTDNSIPIEILHVEFEAVIS